MIPPEYAYDILAIDPGTDTLGASLLRLDVRVEDIELLYAGTWHASRRYDPDGDIALGYGNRAARIQEHRRSLTTLLQEYQPQAVACETPFIGRFKQSGIALSELFSAIQTTVIDFDPTVSFLGVDNRSAKRAVGIMTSRVGKDDVRQKVLNLMNITPRNGVVLANLDEHAIDSIAVGYFAAELLFEEWRILDDHRNGKVGTKRR